MTLAVSAPAMYFGIQKAIEQTVDAQLEVRRDGVERLLKSYPPAPSLDSAQSLPAVAAAPGDELY